MQRSKELIGKLESVLVEVIVSTRDAYLRAKKGRPPLDYWTQLQNRIRAAARTSATAAEFLTTLQRKLQLDAPSSSDSLVMSSLVKLCDDNDLDIELMEHIEREIGFLMAMARQIVDERKAARTPGFTREELEKAAVENGLMGE